MNILVVKKIEESKIEDDKINVEEKVENCEENVLDLIKDYVWKKEKQEILSDFKKDH